MRLLLGIGDAAVSEPGIEVLKRLERWPRRKELLADDTDLVLDLPLLPTRPRRAGSGLDQVVAHQLLEAAIELALLAVEHRLNRCRHVVVDPAPRNAFVEGKRLLMRIEHHLLRLAWIGAHERHAAVAEAGLRHLQRHGGAGEQDVLMAPVKLVGLTRGECQRNERLSPALALPDRPRPSVAPQGIVAARVPPQPELPVYTLIRQPLALGPFCVICQYLLEAGYVSPQSRQRLHRAMIPPLSCRPPFLAAHNVAHRIARHLKLSSNCLDFATLNEVGTPHPTNRVHRDHPPIDPLCDSRTSGHLRLAGEGSNLRADHPRFGVKIARRCTVAPILRCRFVRRYCRDADEKPVIQLITRRLERPLSRPRRSARGRAKVTTGGRTQLIDSTCAGWPRLH